MEHDAVSDANMWLRSAPLEVVRMVRGTVRLDPTPRVLRRVLYQAQVASTDEWTTRVAMRCQDTSYAQAFARALLRAK
jgi:hypothetical protein